MKFKMIGSFALAFTCALTFPVSSAFAGAGEWDNLGTYYFHHITSTDAEVTDVVYSGGGDFKFCINTSSTSYYSYELYENDPGSDNDDLVGAALLSDNGCASFHVAGFVDGDNNRAELYVVNRYDPNAISATLYD